MFLIIMTSFLSVLTYTLAAPTDKNNMLTRWGDDDCAWAGQYMPWTYMDCYSDSNLALGSVGYTIRLTGTGQLPSSWCDAFYNSVTKKCGVSVTPINRCNWGSILTKAETLDGDDNWIPTLLSGIEMTFTIHSIFPLNGDDGHDCVAQAVRSATCSQVQIANGAHCVSDGYYDTSIPEYHALPGPPKGVGVHNP